MKNRNSKKRTNVLLASLVSIALSMTATLYPMLMFLINNQGEFWFSVKDMIVPICLLFAGVAGVVFIVLMLFSGKRLHGLLMASAGILTAGALCYYIQSNYMVSYLPLLTGDAIDWSGYGLWETLSMILWCGVPTVFVILFVVKRQLLKSIVTGCCAALVAMELLVMGMTFATTPITTSKNEAAYFSSEGLYELSEKGNVVLVVSDTFEGTFMNDILEQYPEWKTTLGDFTYYDNTTGTSCFTYFSFAKLLTGQDFPIGMNSADGIAEAFSKQTIIDTVQKNGFDVAYYSVFKPGSNLDGKVLNCVSSALIPDTQTKQSILKLLLKSTLFQGAPHPLKEKFVVLTIDYNNLQLQHSAEGANAPYVVNDTVYRDTLLAQGMKAVDAKPRYVVYELYGAHAPYTLNRDFETISFSEETTLREKQIEASLAALKLLTEYVEELKAAGLYDQTTIIFTADHGFDMRFYPVMLVKEAGKTGTELTVDSTPLSMQEDYKKLLDSVTSGKSFADAVLELNLDDDRTRYALNFRSKDGYGKDTSMRSIIQITGSASQEENYHSVSDEYYMTDDFSGKYTLGETFSHSDDSQNVAMYGFRSNQSMYSHSAVVDVHLNEPLSNDAVYHVEVSNIVNTPQRLIVRINDEEVVSISLEAQEKTEIDIPLSKETGAEKRITIHMEAPDAVLSHGSIETLGWSEYNSLMFGDGTIR